MSDKRFLSWGAGKPVAFVMFARQIVANADEIISFVNLILTGEHLDKFPKPPSTQQMLRQYHDHKAMLAGVCRAIMGPEVAKELLPEKMRILLDKQRTLSRLPLEDRQKIVDEIVQDPANQEMSKDVAQIVFEGFKQHTDEIRANLKGESNERDLTTEDVSHPAMQYFFRVWVPCMLVHGQWATRIYARARRGDLDSLLMLLRLDKSILGDPFIADQLHQAHAGGKRGLAGKISAAIKGRCKPLKRRQGKIQLGSMISLLARFYKTTVEAPEIEELFHAAAAVKRPERGMDTDLPYPETLAREMRMKRAIWVILKPLGQGWAEKN